MGFFSDFLFGSKGIPEKFVDLTPSEFAATRQPTADALTGLIKAGGGAPFDGPLHAGITSQEQSIVDTAVTQAAGNDPLSQATSGLVDRTLGGEFVRGNAGLDAAVKSAVDPTRGAIASLDLPQLSPKLDASGNRIVTAGDNPFTTAAQIGVTGAENALSDIERAVRSESFQREETRRQEAIKLASDVASGALKKTILGLKAAALPRLIEDLGIQRGLVEYNDRINRLLETINVGVQIGAPVAAKTAGSPGSKGIFGKALSFAAGAGIGSGGFSSSGGSAFGDTGFGGVDPASAFDPGP